jgi:hypothetical protein
MTGRRHAGARRLLARIRSDKIVGRNSTARNKGALH